MWQWLACLFGHHDWTCAAAEGVPATQEQLEGGIEGFYSYARMYCKHCKQESKLNARRYSDDGSKSRSK